MADSSFSPKPPPAQTSSASSVKFGSNVVLLLHVHVHVETLTPVESPGKSGADDSLMCGFWVISKMHLFDQIGYTDEHYVLQLSLGKINAMNSFSITRYQL